MSTPTKTEILLGGVPATAVKRDGSTEDIHLRILKISEYPRFAMLMDDEARSIEMLCDRPPGWSDSLDPESHEVLVAKAEEINAAFFRWSARRVARAERIMPGASAALLNSRITSPASPPSAA